MKTELLSFLGASVRQRLFVLLVSACSLSASAQEFRAWGPQVRYRNQILLEDPFGASKGEFINPNEQLNALQVRCLNPKERGVLVSIGSFRALNMAALGGFETLFQLDYDFTVSALNYLNREFIRISNDRHEYLSYLFLGEKYPYLLDKVRAGKITDRHYLISLEAIAYAMPEGQYYLNLAKLNLALPRISQTYIDLLLSKFNHYSRPISGPDKHSNQLLNYLFYKKPFLNRDSFSYLKFYYLFFKGSEKQTFFGDDQLFSNLKGLVHSNNLVIFAADLTQRKGIISLAAAIRGEKQKVKALDVSNVLSWVGEKTPERSPRFFQNLREFPWTDQGRVFLTDEWSPNASVISIDEMDERFLLTDEWKTRVLHQKAEVTLWKYFAFDHSWIDAFEAAWNPTYWNKGLSNLLFSGEIPHRSGNFLHFYPRGICQ